MLQPDEEMFSKLVIEYSGGAHVDCCGVVVWIAVVIPSGWLLHHGDNRGRHSANHNLLPDMHLCVPVLRVKTCRDSRLV